LSARPAQNLLKAKVITVRANLHATKINQDELLRSFVDRRDEADPSARKVLDAFRRVAERLPLDAGEWREIVALNESWRDTLSDSEVIRHLTAICHTRNPRKGRRRR
jgi:hypothetical protein